MKQVLSIEEAAVESGLSKETIRRAVKRRNLPVVRIGRRVLIQRPDFAAWLRGEAPGPIGRPMTDDEVGMKIAALRDQGETPARNQHHGDVSALLARIADALEGIRDDLNGITGRMTDQLK